MKTKTIILLLISIVFASEQLIGQVFEEKFKIDFSQNLNSNQIAQKLNQESYDIIELNDDMYHYSGGWYISNDGQNTLNTYSTVTLLDEYSQVQKDNQDYSIQWVDPFAIPSTNPLYDPTTSVANMVISDLMTRRLGVIEDESFVTYGMNANNDFFVRKRDALGNIQWTSKISRINGSEDIEDQFITNVGDINTEVSNKLIFPLVSRFNGQGGEAFNRPAILILDNSGSISLFKEFNFYLGEKIGHVVPGFVQQSEDGGFYITFYNQFDIGHSKCFLLKLDDQFDVEWAINSLYSIQYPIYEEAGFFYTAGFPVGDPTKSGISKWSVDQSNNSVAIVAHSKLGAFIVSSMIKKNNNWVLVGDYNNRMSAIEISNDLSTVLDFDYYSSQFAWTSKGKISDENYLIGLGSSSWETFYFYWPVSQQVTPVYLPDMPYIVKTDIDHSTFCSDEWPEELSSGGNNMVWLEDITEFIPTVSLDIETSVLSPWKSTKLTECCTYALQPTEEVFICCNSINNGSFTWEVNLGTDFPANGTGTLTGGGVIGSVNLANNEGGVLDLTLSEPGTYTFYFTDINDCIGQATITVKCFEEPTLTYPLSSDPICIGPTTGSQNLPYFGFSGSWSGTGIAGSVPNQKFNPWLGCTGNQTINYTYTDNNGCIRDSIFDITVTKCIVATKELTICQGDFSPINLLSISGNTVGENYSYFTYNGNNIGNMFTPPSYGQFTLEECYVVGNCTLCFPVQITVTMCKSNFIIQAEEDIEYSNVKVYNTAGQLVSVQDLRGQTDPIEFMVNWKQIETMNQIMIFEFVAIDGRKFWFKR